MYIRFTQQKKEMENIQVKGVLVDRCNTRRHITETGSSKLKLTSKTKGQKRRNKQTNKQAKKFIIGKKELESTSLLGMNGNCRTIYKWFFPSLKLKSRKTREKNIAVYIRKSITFSFKFLLDG